MVPFYNGSEAEGRANFKKFIDIGTLCLFKYPILDSDIHPGPTVDNTREVPYEELNGLQVSS